MKNKQFSFNASPMIKARRTKFNTLSHNLKTSMNVGTLYPIYCEEVLPGDTFKVKENHVTRLTSAYIKPPMDMIYQDTYFFFCPSRKYYNRWNEVFGENPNGAWANTEQVSVPGVVNGEIHVGSVGDYLTAFPLTKDFDLTDTNRLPSVIPFRAFADIWNYYFRDENVTDPVNIQLGELGEYEFFNNGEWSPTNYFGKLPKVSKFHDYFTSCLPSPQKGDPVELSLTAGFLPLKVSESMTYLGGPAKFNFVNHSTQEYLENGTYDLGLFNGNIQNANIQSFSAVQSQDFTLNDNIDLTTTNLGINANNIGAVSVNDLRYAFQLQKLLERDARGGTRLQEYILSHFGVSTPDMRMQVPEFLGGRRVPLNTQQVAQTSSYVDGSDTFLASVGGYSLSNGDSRFSKGFTEHGWIIGVSCLRYHHTYQQGIDKRFLRRSKLDFYDPVFANIGEQPVYKSEIFAYNTYVNTNDNSIFNLEGEILGYQEAFADYRFRNNRITGQMRSNVVNSLDVWHFGDYYISAPSLSKSFIEETPIFVDRTIAVDSESQDQFIVDYWFDVEAVREMPLYSIPGLVDHH